MKRWGLLGLLIAGMLAFATLPRSASAVDPPGGNDDDTSFHSTEFIRVIDGDTLEMWRKQSTWGIGLVGVVAPMGNTPCGEAATGRMWELTYGTISFESEPGVTLDERDRRMYQAFTADGTLLAKQMVSEGWVKASRKPSTYRNELVRAEIEAKVAHRGCLWGKERGPRGFKRNRTQGQPQIVAPAASLISGAGASVDSPAPVVSGGGSTVSNAVSVAGYQDILTVGGFTNGTTFEFLPDGRILVAEKHGILKVANGTTVSTVIDISSMVNDYWDHGLIGVAADPNFAANGYIYLSFTYENDPIDYAGPKTNRVIRLTMTGNTASLATQAIILGSLVGSNCKGFPAQADCIPSEGASHSIGMPEFGGDGYLYVTTGDASDFNSVDPEALRSQDPNILSGKVLRVNPDGSGVADNPYWDGNPQHARSKVYAIGVRNPFRQGVNPNTGRLYVGDVGWNSWEEINVVRPGANFGWPCYEGDGPQAGYSPFAACQALYNQGASAHTKPLYTWSHAGGSSAAVGGAFTTSYTGAQANAYFFGDYGQGFVKYMKTDANDAIVGSVQDFASNLGSPVSIQRGLNGEIYYLAIETGQVRNFDSAASNQRPVVVMSATPTDGLAPLAVNFSAAGTSDPEGDALTYAWNFGDSSTGTGLTTSHTYTTNAVRTATLTVTDARGASTSTSKTITVGNRAPVITMTSPLAGPTYKVGDRIQLAASATDADDGGAVPSSGISWSIILHHGTHIHPFLNLTGSTNFFDVPDHGDDTYFEITATATDTGGLTASVTRNIYPQTVQFTLNSTPPGMLLVYGGTAVTAPYTATTVANGTVTIGAVSPSGNGEFVSWSDGGAQQHNVNAGTAAAASYTALYNLNIKFDDLANPNRALNGQYPTGEIDWGTGKWYLSAPFAADPTNSVSFSTFVATSQTFSFLTPRRLISVRAFNGGAATTVSFACAGNSTKSQAIGAGGNAVITMGWLNPCTTITVTSSNGWDTNFDDFLYAISAVQDTTAPTISNVIASPTGTTTATVTWTTDEASTSQVNYGTTTGYGSSQPVAPDPALVTSHSVNLTGLAPNQSYHYQVRSGDGSNNVTLSGDFTLNMPPADLTPPVISNVGVTNLTTTGATINWTTDEIANTRVEYGLTAAYGTFSPLNASLVLSHTQALSNLTPSTTYFFRVLSADGSGNASSLAGGTFTTATPPPVTSANFNDLTNPNRTLTGQYPTGAIDWGTNKWYLSGPFGQLTTNSISFLSSGVTSQTFAFVSPRRLLSIDAYNGGGASSTVTIGCTGNTTRSVAVSAFTLQTIATNFTQPCTTVTITSSNGWDTNFDNLTWDAAPSDTTAPVLTTPVVSNITATGATITWTTDEASNEQVEYGLTAAYGSFAPASLGPATNLSHSVTLSGLTPSTPYNFRAASRDATGNAGFSGNVTFSTIAAPPDNTPPVITGVTATNVTSSSATITWTTDENANEQVDYGLTTSYGTLVPATPGAAVNLSHSVTLTGLTASTPYNYQVLSRDLNGNLRTAGNFTFTTPAPAPPNGALKFDGSDDIASAADSASLDLAGPLTIEAWVKFDAAAANKYQTIVFKRSAATGNQLAYALYYYNGLQFEMRSGTKTYAVNDNEPIAPGAWHHIAAVYDRVTMRVYRDGVQTASAPATAAITLTTGAVTVGANPVWTNELFTGTVDEIRLSKSARYTTTFSPPSAFTSDANAVALWHMDEGTGQTVADASGNGNTLTRGTTSSAETRDPAWVAGTSFTAGAAAFAPLMALPLAPSDAIVTDAPARHSKRRGRRLPPTG